MSAHRGRLSRREDSPEVPRGNSRTAPSGDFADGQDAYEDYLDGLYDDYLGNSYDGEMPEPESPYP